MTRLPGFHSPREYLDLARSPDATAGELRALAGSAYDFVREAVAANPSALPEVLASLLPKTIRSFNDSVLLLALVRNERTPAEVLAAVPALVLPRLGVRDDHKSFEVAVALAQRPDAPEDALAALVSDQRATTELRKVLARETTHGPLRERLLADRSERVRRAAASERPMRGATGPLFWALAEAFGVIMADITASGAPGPVVIAEDWADEPGRPSAWLSWEDGARCGVAISAEQSFADNIVLLADQVQEAMVEVLCRTGKPAVWPECPDHPGSHPLKPVGAGGAATWVCPRTDRAIAEIGALTPLGTGRP